MTTITTPRGAIVAQRAAQLVIRSENANIQFNDADNHGVRKAIIDISIKSFPSDKYEYIRSFYIAYHDDEGYWATPRSATVHSGKSNTKVELGYELGDKIYLEGNKFTIEPDHNGNLKLNPQRSGFDGGADHNPEFAI